MAEYTTCQKPRKDKVMTNHENTTSMVVSAVVSQEGQKQIKRATACAVALAKAVEKKTGLKLTA